MSPTLFTWKGYRFFFFSREEPRPHVHVTCADGEAKFWLGPAVSLAKNYRLSGSEVSKLKKVVEEKKDEIVRAWNDRFQGRSH
ncbi:MAG: DUF4160 domain-containing protein [Candidatus Brocadiia bacterium]